MPETGETGAARRARLLAAARARGRFPVVIVGAGINGLGTFRDLCLQGVDCLIVDRGDYCSGTSAAPSRMIHGGLKYLETGEFRLVAESVRERNRLLRNAPHLVRPLEMVIPLPRRFGGELASALRFLGLKTKMRRRGKLIIEAGLTAYDFFGRKTRVMPPHRSISRAELYATLPDLAEGMIGGSSYFDAQIAIPERLGVELALDGMAANPASVALNHVAVEGRDGTALRLVDRIGGDAFTVQPDLVINAAGPWIDRTNRAMAAESTLIGGTKGSHLLLDLPALRDELGDRMVYFDPGDGRLLLVAQLEGRVLLGSTDIPADDPDAAVCGDDEIDYMLDGLRAVFPRIGATRRHIVFTYCGVRPLPRGDSSDPGAISRDHSIAVAEPAGDRSFPILSLVGGKWTTFRAFAEQTADMVLARLGAPRRTGTLELAIGGGHGLSNRAEDWSRLHAEVAERLGGDGTRAWALVRRFGARSLEAVPYCRGSADPLTTLPGIGRGEIAFMAETEQVEHIADLALRRTSIALAGHLTSAAVRELAEVVGELRGWDAARRDAEAEGLAEAMLRRHRIDIATGRLV
ncbi:MAG: glycerol-3-phosphate dehydrogenase/oxidase [Alphaproteobacteria bacterium]